jgi:hypothetical protein
LVGHSVGSYIGLEIVRRLRAHGLAGEDFDTRISGVVGLFPTVVDIARSESGVKLAVRFPFPLSPIISDLVGMMRFANSRDSPFSKTQTSHSSCRYLQASSAC